jgi:hypothetical protein
VNEKELVETTKQQNSYGKAMREVVLTQVLELPCAIARVVRAWIREVSKKVSVQGKCSQVEAKEKQFIVPAIGIDSER